MLDFLLAALGTVLLVASLVTSVHLGVMGVASLVYRRPKRPAEVPPVRFLVVIPAHNEELLIGQTLAAINAAKRPRDQVLVVDDRSTDRTAEIAEEHGCHVLRRDPSAEPGRAAARAAGIERAAGLEWDAMVMLDADSIVEPSYFDRCEEALATGAVALQARSEAAHGKRLVDQAALASFAVQGVMLPRGREVLHLPVRLRGTGMVLARSVVARLDFRARASEDLQVSLDLVREGVRTRHIDDARLRSANADTWKVASKQKERYEAGRMNAAREFVPALLACRSAAGFESAWFLISPPFAPAAGVAAIALICGLLAGANWLTIAAGASLCMLVVALAIAAVQARLGPRLLLAMLVAPVYVAWKLAVQFRALVGLRGGLKEFGATERVVREP